MRRSGDCEDYSIAKFYALRQLGFSDEELRIVVLKDAIRGVGHAVLAVYTDDDIRILDSLSDMVLTHTVYRHYQPLSSVSEVARWMHAKPSGRVPLVN